MLYHTVDEYYAKKQELLNRINQQYDQDDLNDIEDKDFKLWKELARSLVRSSAGSKSMKEYYTPSTINLEFADALEELIVYLKKLEYDVQDIHWINIKRALANFTGFTTSNNLKLASYENVDDDSAVKLYFSYIDNPYVFTIIPKFDSRSARTILKFRLEPFTNTQQLN